MKNKKAVLKDTAINIRLTTSQKEQYIEEAKACNMTLSEYVLQVLQNKQITVIEKGSDIAEALYDLNETLNHCVKNPKISIEGTRQAVDNSVSKLKSRMEGV